jgi:hypothetical protein
VTKGKRGDAHHQKRERRQLSGIMPLRDDHRIMRFDRLSASPPCWSRLRIEGWLVPLGQSVRGERSPEPRMAAPEAGDKHPAREAALTSVRATRPLGYEGAEGERYPPFAPSDLRESYGL